MDLSTVEPVEVKWRSWVWLVGNIAHHSNQELSSRGCRALKLLYYSPASFGGIADYAHEQANALVEAGADVTLLTTLTYPTGRREQYKILPILQDLKPEHPISTRLLKGTRYVAVTLGNVKTLVRVIRQQSFRYVLLGSYSEYLAPLWAGDLRRLARQGIVFGAIVHDPVRDFVLGPLWWHRWSIACGYSFLREAFVHEAIELDTVRPMPQLRTTVVPHGVYRFPEATLSRQEMRSQLNLPADATVMLAFGHIRANKNLDLVIRAMAQVPEVYLVVAGNEMSASQPLVPGYQALASELGVGDRIRWQVRFIPDIEVGDFFEAADLVMLTYSQSFRSASGVLNAAAQYHVPCIASGGQGSLASVVNRYELGVWVEPDSLTSLVAELKLWLEHPANPDWTTYHNQNSWTNNAELTLTSMKG